jgi:hypothetical protein
VPTVKETPVAERAPDVMKRAEQVLHWRVTAPLAVLVSDRDVCALPR